MNRSKFLRYCLISLLCVSLSPAALFSQDTVVKEFSGSGGKNTRPFTVSNGWEIQWNATGNIFQLYLYDNEGSLKGVPANQQGQGPGSSYQAKGGEYYLQVNALGNWDVKIVQINTEGTHSATTVFSGSGGQNTRPFTTDGAWEIQWNATGNIFQLYLYDENGKLVGVPANQQGPGEGNSYQPKAGTYYLQVNTSKDWEIEIVPVP